jgi:soluble lytic murein transglycosylase-like protein
MPSSARTPPCNVPLAHVGSRIAIAFTLVAALPATPHAQVYMGQDAGGSIVLSNHASEDVSTVVVAAAAGAEPNSTVPAPPPVGRPLWRDPPSSLSGPIQRAAHRHQLPLPLLTAVIAVESGFNHRAVSPKGAQGLMQLMPRTARRFGVRDSLAVEDNLEGGSAYLRWLLGHFDQDVSLALAAYNAGEGAVERAGRRIPPYRETQDYVRKVLALATQRQPEAWPSPLR